MTSFLFCKCNFISCFPAADDDEIPQELLLGKHQLNELGSESAKIKAMGISSRVLYTVLIEIVLMDCCVFAILLLMYILIMISVVADPIRQASKAAEHTGKEHPGWIQADHHDEPCKLLSYLL